MTYASPPTAASFPLLRSPSMTETQSAPIPFASRSQIALKIVLFDGEKKSDSVQLATISTRETRFVMAAASTFFSASMLDGSFVGNGIFGLPTAYQCNVA